MSRHEQGKEVVKEMKKKGKRKRSGKEQKQ